MVALRPIAHAPAYVAGMFVLRGAVIPVVDLCQLMLSTPCADRMSSRIMLVRLGDHVLGVLAEQVTEAMQIQRQAAGISVPGAPYLGDLYFDETGAMVQQLEVAHLLPTELQQRLLA